MKKREMKEQIEKELENVVVKSYPIKSRWEKIYEKILDWIFGQEKWETLADMEYEVYEKKYLQYLHKKKDL